LEEEVEKEGTTGEEPVACDDMAPKTTKNLTKTNRKSFLWSGCVAVATQTEDSEYGGVCSNVLQPWLQNCLPVGRKSDIALDLVSSIVLLVSLDNNCSFKIELILRCPIGQQIYFVFEPT